MGSNAFSPKAFATSKGITAQRLTIRGKRFYSDIGSILEGRNRRVRQRLWSESSTIDGPTPTSRATLHHVVPRPNHLEPAIATNTNKRLRLGRTLHQTQLFGKRCGGEQSNGDTTQAYERVFRGCPDHLTAIYYHSVLLLYRML